jgi:type IV secretory pathway VirB2 component (pilin)
LGSIAFTWAIVGAIILGIIMFFSSDFFWDIWSAINY